MTDSAAPGLPIVNARKEDIFPTLTAAQLARIRPHGRVRQVSARSSSKPARPSSPSLS
jgi:hypothetical protein